MLRYLLPSLSFKKHPRVGNDVREGEKDKRSKETARKRRRKKRSARRRRRRRRKRGRESKVTLNASRYHVREHLGGSFFVTRYAFLFACSRIAVKHARDIDSFDVEDRGGGAKRDKNARGCPERNQSLFPRGRE